MGHPPAVSRANHGAFRRGRETPSSRWSPVHEDIQPPSRSVSTVRVSTAAVLRTTLTVFAVVLAVYVVYLLRRPITWLLIATFIALALAPPVRFLSRWMRRGFAIVAVYIGLLLVPTGLGVLVVPPVVTQAQHFVDDAPRYAKDVTNYIEGNHTLRNLQRKYDIGGQLQKKASELPGKIGSAASVLADIGLGVVNSVFAVVTILILAAFMLARGPQWRDAALRLVPPHHAAAWRRVTDEIAGAVGNYVGGAIAQAVIAGVTSYLVMLILGVPFRVPLAVLVGLFDLIPLVGATVAAVVVGIVTAFVDFPTATIVWAIWAILYQQVENNVIQPRIQSRAVDVQPFVVLVAVLFGSTLFGVLGALLAVPLAASIQIVVREVLRYRKLVARRDLTA
jgi:predicted PurR-regulated permease PerM